MFEQVTIYVHHVHIFWRHFYKIGSFQLNMVFTELQKKKAKSTRKTNFEKKNLVVTPLLLII